ncbi:MAG: TatD family hydrolase [Candidatus Thorarchaeota archaeon]
MLVDVHNHFSYYNEDIDRALADISENRMLMVSVSTDFESYEDTLKLAKQSDLILPAFAIHPIMAHKHIDDLERIRKSADGALVLGEIGLDKLWIEDQSHFPPQLPLLDVFLESANKGDKVVILHVAGAESEVLERLETHSIQRAIIHDYYGPVELVDKIIEAGFYFALDRSYLEEYKPQIQGWGERLQIASMIPDNRFLIETDGPNKPPRRMPFEALQIVAERIAELRGSTPEEIHVQSTCNFKNLLSGSPGLDKYIKLLQ